MTLDPQIAQRLKRDPDGPIVVMIQQYDTRKAFMPGQMDEEALDRTLNSDRAIFWSHSRREYWRKDDTSGHVQYVKFVSLDCDGDALFIEVDQVDAAYRTGKCTCFLEEGSLGAVVDSAKND